MGHPVISPLPHTYIFQGISQCRAQSVHRDFIEPKYLRGMPDDHERMHGERPGSLREDREVRFTGRRTSDGGVLIAEIPVRENERLHSRPEWQLALRVASSKGLSKSDLMPKFLLYVCEQRLLENIQDITEQRIGTQIFNRATDYNPGEDNIVRSYARMLRKRLDEYFEGEGQDEPIRIVIPRGGYVPVFKYSENAGNPSSDPALQKMAEGSVRTMRRRSLTPRRTSTHREDRV